MRSRAAGLQARLAEAGTPERAAGEKAYLKSDLEFFGSGLAAIRAVAKQALSEDPGIGHDDLISLVRELWARPVFECRLLGVELLDRRRRLLTTADLSFVEELLRRSRTWALVDALAGDVASSIVAADPPGGGRVVDLWAADDDFWLRRSALLAMRASVRAGIPGAHERFFGYADAMLDEREFFIRKAIGWVLREVGRRQTEQVVAWLEPRTGRASGVTMREAVRYLDPADRDRLMQAYRQRRAVAE